MKAKTEFARQIIDLVCGLRVVFGLLTVILVGTASAEELTLSVVWTVTPTDPGGWSGTKTLTVTNGNWVYTGNLTNANGGCEVMRSESGSGLFSIPSAPNPPVSFSFQVNETVSWSNTFCGGTVESGTMQDGPVTISATPTSGGFTLSTNTVYPPDYDYGGAQMTVTATGFLAGPPSITTTSLPKATAGLTYSAALSATGGIQPYSFSVASGSLPDGFTLDAPTGIISSSGSPIPDLGIYPLTFQVTDSTGAMAPTPASLSLRVVGLTLSRMSLVQVRAVASPKGGSFAYTTDLLYGTNIAGIELADGITALTNPNLTNLIDPDNTSTNGSPTPGGLASITASYTTSSGEIYSRKFGVPTFGMSCYFTTLESDWGSPPKACKNYKYKGVIYTGTVTNPDGLTGTFCSSFIKDSTVQGSAVLNDGTIIQYDVNTGMFNTVDEIVGHDGTPVVANETVARSLSIIPQKGVLVDVDQVGTGLLANDTGGAIKGYRLDLYRGTGKAVCSNYDNIISVSACTPKQTACPSSVIH